MESLKHKLENRKGTAAVIGLSPSSPLRGVVIDAIDAYFTSLPTRPVQLPADQRTFGELQHFLETGKTLRN